MYNNATYDVPESERTFHPTYGIFNRCTRLHKFADIYKRDNCATYVTGFDMPDSEFPNCWKAALFFFSCAAILLCFTFLTAIMSLCARSICKKSIFTVTGLVQSIAGKPGMYSVLDKTNCEHIHIYICLFLIFIQQLIGKVCYVMVLSFYPPTCFCMRTQNVFDIFNETYWVGLRPCSCPFICIVTNPHFIDFWHLIENITIFVSAQNFFFNIDKISCLS